MSDEVAKTTVESVKTMSDGSVKIAVEKYNELIETIAEQKGKIGDLNHRLNKALSEPPIINRRVVEKTAEMVSEDHRVWGNTFMGVGVSLFAVGVIRRKLA